MALIELSQVTKYYEMGNQVVRALDGIDISVTRNDYMAFIGSSGSGKSTLLRSVNGLNPVVRGEVQVCTSKGMQSVTQACSQDLRELRLTHISMVFQSFGLLPWRR